MYLGNKKMKKCRYGCGKMVFWDDSINDKKIKYRETDTGDLHDYPRCADLLKEQGKDLSILKKR
jgi:hypothetical protein